MTRKIITLLLCLIITIPCVQAKMLRAGWRGGVRLSDPEISDTDEPVLGGVHFGRFARAQLFVFYIQPEVLFHVILPENSQSATRTLYVPDLAVSIPLVGGISLFGFRVQLGPTFNWLLPASTESGGMYEEGTFYNAGFQVGFGIDLCNMIIDLKGEILGDRDNLVWNSHVRYPWMLSVGYDFL